MSKLSIIQFPLWYGCDRRGGEFAPACLCNHTFIEKLRAQGIEIGCLETISPREAVDKYGSHQSAKYLAEIVDADKRLAQIVGEKLKIGSKVLTIGGDHALGLGSVAGSLELDVNVALIWFDAHGDMNTESTSPTGNVHGMPVAALMGLCDSELNDVAKNKINPRNIFWIGARDLDEGEQKLAEQLKLNIYSTEYIHTHGMQSVMADVANKMRQQGIEHIHLSFDIDAMDPEYVFATGVPVPNGLLQNDLDDFLHSMKSLSDKLCSIDFVEYNPNLDKQDICKKWCERTLVDLCGLFD